MFPIFILWTAVLPFISFAGSFEGPKVVWFWIGGLLMTLYYAVIVWQKKVLTIDPTLVLFSTWVVVLGIASMVGLHPAASFAGGSYRHQGVLFFYTLILVAYSSMRMPIMLRRGLHIMGLLTAIAETFVVLYQAQVLHMARPIGTFGEPNAVAGFLATSQFWVLSKKSLPFVVRSSVSAFLAMGVLMTQSRAGIAMTGVIVLFFGISQLYRVRLSAVKTGTILGLISSMTLIGFVQYTRISTTRRVSQFENRSMFFSVGIEEVLKRPLLGYGAESGEAVFDRHFARISMPLADYMIDRSHNIFLDVALWSGVIGLLVFLSWIGYSLVCLYAAQDFLRLTFVAGWIVFACIQPVGVVHWVQLILLLYLPPYFYEK